MLWQPAIVSIARTWNIHKPSVQFSSVLLLSVDAKATELSHSRQCRHHHSVPHSEDRSVVVLWKWWVGGGREIRGQEVVRDLSNVTINTADDVVADDFQTDQRRRFISLVQHKRHQPVRVDIECSKRALICWNHKTPAQSDHYRPKAINNIFHGHVSHWVLCGGTRTRTHYKIYNTTQNVKRYNSRRQWLSRVPRHIKAKTFTLTTSHLDRPPAVTAGRRTDMPPLSISRYSIAEREKRMDISLPADITECIIAWQTQLIKRSMMIITMILKIRRSFLKETTINEPECERLRVVIWCLRHCICATSIVNAVRTGVRMASKSQLQRSSRRMNDVPAVKR